MKLISFILFEFLFFDTKGMKRSSSRIEKLKHQSFEQNETLQTKPSLVMTDSILHASFLTNIDQKLEKYQKKKMSTSEGRLEEKPNNEKRHVFPFLI